MMFQKLCVKELSLDISDGILFKSYRVDTIHYIWNIHGIYSRVSLVSLLKVWRSITETRKDDDISGNVMAFLWMQRCFICRVARLDLSKFIGGG